MITSSYRISLIFIFSDGYITAPTTNDIMEETIDDCFTLKDLAITNCVKHRTNVDCGKGTQQLMCLSKAKITVAQLLYL